MNFPKINLHCHSNYSDGNNSILEIVTTSLKIGLNYLAITDHFTNSWKSDIIPTLNSFEKIESYLEEISICQNNLKNANENLRLYKGIEVDIGSSEKYIKNLIDPSKFDIILFEYLETLEGLAYVNNLIEDWVRKISRVNLPLFGLAHFDPSNFIYSGLDRLIQLLKKYDIYFEFNSSYSHFYSRKNEIFFEKLKKHQIPVGIGSDAHHSKHLVLMEEPLYRVKDYGLESNLIRLIELLKKEKC